MPGDWAPAWRHRRAGGCHAYRRRVSKAITTLLAELGCQADLVTTLRAGSGQRCPALRAELGGGQTLRATGEAPHRSSSTLNGRAVRWAEYRATDRGIQ